MSILAEIEEAVPALRRYAWSLLRHPHDAEDLVQDTLLRALSSLPREPGITAVRPWLFTILHNLSVSRWRSLRRRAAARFTPEDKVGPSQDWHLATRDLMRGLEALSEDQRRVLLLVSVEGFDYREVAAILGLPIGTVMSRLSRARDALAAQMEEGQRQPLRRVK
ncbi:RNA polymerase sigma factor [Acetobacteraceae bacterium H6797]|nr:RNA polymerase sigma factor [Acetobacteraceae bacterium H6797]